VRCGATENTRLYETRPFLAYSVDAAAPSRASPISRKSAVKQRWPDQPGDFPFSSVALLYTNDAAKVKLHDFSFFVARNKQGNEFAEKRQVADDHHVAAGLFEGFFRCGIGYFGSSTGAGAALVAAAEVGRRIDAVVSRGGRPDLAGDALPRVQSPTLLIVGGYDDMVIRLNKEALAELRCERELKIVPGATHLFEEPGALEAVARLAADWFRRHFHAHLEAID
jgi:pimeloyl-ACP methyl ester carboxylesterase